MKIMPMKTEDFIALHLDDDVSQLAFQAGKYPEIDMPFALSQIEGRRKARVKIPSWALRDGIVYPPRRAMEQCSSETTAMYKRSVAERILRGFSGENGFSMADLTGGFGVDCAFFSTLFDEAVYIERNKELCKVAQHNFQCLGLNNIKVVCGDAKEAFFPMKPCFFAYIDPDRRDADGTRKYALEDCSPNVVEMNSELLKKATVAMIKCSPMADWRKAANNLTGVREVHIVSVGNECKELLLVMSENDLGNGGLRVFCINDQQRFSFESEEEKQCSCAIAPPFPSDLPGFLYVPNASIMKAGCFSLLCKRYGVKMAERNSHLFVSPDEIGDFPGKRYKITAVSTMNKKELKTKLRDVKEACVAVRNFPLSADALRLRLGLTDGGGIFVFGTTDSASRHIIIVCERV